MARSDRDAERRVLASYLGEDFSSVSDMPYAVDNHYFQSRCMEVARDARRAERSLKLTRARPVILFASKLQSRKRCTDLLARLQESVAGPGMERTLSGDRWRCERAGVSREQAVDSGLEGVVSVGSGTSRSSPGFDMATVFVLPSRHEPWG